MGYTFAMSGSFAFDKKLPDDVLAIFKHINGNCELGTEWYRSQFKNEHIEACWCPWRYDETQNGLGKIQYVNDMNHNYYFIDWIAWIIESVCIPNDLKLNGRGYWQDDNNYEERDEHAFDLGYLPLGDGTFDVIDNIIKVKGVFFGSNDWKKTVRRVNNIVKPKEVINKKPTCEVKGSFCVTGKVSMTLNEFQKLGVEHGYEFKGSVTKNLTYLVCNDTNSTSSKIKNARNFGVKVVTEDEFKKIIGL